MRFHLGYKQITLERVFDTFRCPFLPVSVCELPRLKIRGDVQVTSRQQKPALLIALIQMPRILLRTVAEHLRCNHGVQETRASCVSDIAEEVIHLLAR